MSTSDPERLLDSEGLGEALTTDLARAASHDVGYDVAAGAARFDAMLASGVPVRAMEGPRPGAQRRVAPPRVWAWPWAWR